MPNSKRRRKPVKRQEKYEFKPDRPEIHPFKQLVLTQAQRERLLKWFLLSLVCVVLLILQDTLMARFRFNGATTDLAVIGILTVGIYVGGETGSLFALIASTVYVLSGSAPGPYSIALLTLPTIGASLLRQSLWRRSFGSIWVCVSLCAMVYEMAVFIVGVISGLTILSRWFVYLSTGISCVILSAPLYPLVKRIAAIGDDPWKD